MKKLIPLVVKASQIEHVSLYFSAVFVVNLEAKGYFFLLFRGGNECIDPKNCYTRHNFI